MAIDDALGDAIKASIGPSTGPVDPAPVLGAVRRRRNRRRKRRGAMAATLVVFAGVSAGLVVRDRDAGTDRLATVATGATGASSAAPAASTAAATTTTRDLRVSTAIPTALAAYERPFALPVVEPGQSCPVTPTRLVDGIRVQGGAVARTAVVDGAEGVGPNIIDGLHDVAAIWIANDQAPDDLLVRGRRLDADGIVRFGTTGAIAAPILEWDALHFTRPRKATATGVPAGWGFVPTALWVPGAGCYGLQIDGKDFSEVIVFQVVVSAR